MKIYTEIIIYNFLIKIMITSEYRKRIYLMTIYLMKLNYTQHVLFIQFIYC